MENLDANEQESSTVQDETTESSPVQVEEATSQKATEKEPPFHEHPRWKEMQEEKRQLLEEKRQLLELANKMTPHQQAVQVEQNIYEAKTPEEKAFWQQIEKVADSISAKREKKLRDELETEKQVLYKQTSQLLANEFLKSHPDIKKGSEELKQIVSTAQGRSLDLDEAYKLVMFDKNVELAAARKQEKTQETLKQKSAANLETKTIPKTVMKEKEKERSMGEIMDELVKESGLTY